AGSDRHQLRLRHQQQSRGHGRQSGRSGPRPGRLRSQQLGRRRPGNPRLSRPRAHGHPAAAHHHDQARELPVMNAPFHARGSGLRDPFTAFVADEATAELLRPVAVEHGWSPEKVNKGGLRNAVQTLSVSASPSILFVDLSESGDPLSDINALAEVCEPGTVVIAAGQVNDVRLYRDLVASGIQDYLLKPFTADQLRDTFAHAQM